MNYILKTHEMTYTVSDAGAELVSAKSSDNTEYIWQTAADSWQRRSPILFPICGRIANDEYTYKGKMYNMGIHGFLPSSTMKVISSSDNSLSMRLTSCERTLSVYPFDFELTVDFTARENSLSVSVTVRNTGNDEMPFMLGAHPGFALPLDAGLSFGNYSLDFSPADKLTLYPLLPEGKFPDGTSQEYMLNNGIMPVNPEEIYRLKTIMFSGTAGKVKLFSASGKHSAELSFCDKFRYLCIWKDTALSANFICLEPWSSLPVGNPSPEDFSSRPGMYRLAKGKSEKFTYEITFR